MLQAEKNAVAARALALGLPAAAPGPASLSRPGGAYDGHRARMTLDWFAQLEAEPLPDDRTARRVVGPDGLGHGHAGHDRTLQEAHKAHSVCAAPERGLGAALRATTVRGLGAVRSRRTTKSGPRTSAGTRSM